MASIGEFLPTKGTLKLDLLIRKASNIS